MSAELVSCSLCGRTGEQGKPYSKMDDGSFICIKCAENPASGEKRLAASAPKEEEEEQK